MEIKCIKSAARLLDKDCVNNRGLDLSKEVLLVSVGQRAAVLQAVKVGGKKEFYCSARLKPDLAHAKQSSRFFFKPPTLMNGSSADL